MSHCEHCNHVDFKVADSANRLEALKLDQSFIVQAPAALAAGNGLQIPIASSWEGIAPDQGDRAFQLHNV